MQSTSKNQGRSATCATLLPTYPHQTKTFDLFPFMSRYPRQGGSRQTDRTSTLSLHVSSEVKNAKYCTLYSFSVSSSQHRSVVRHVQYLQGTLVEALCHADPKTATSVFAQLLLLVGRVAPCALSASSPARPPPGARRSLQQRRNAWPAPRLKEDDKQVRSGGGRARDARSVPA